MINSLPLFHRIKGQKVLVLGSGDTAEPKIRLIERAGGIIEDDIQRAIDEGVKVAFVAYDDAEACKVAAINLRCAGMLVNVVDMPDLCDFTTPSILDRDPVLIAIGTGGASAGLAKHVRLRLDAILPQSLGKLASALLSAREKLRAKHPDGADRRRVIDAALREGGELDPFDAASADKVESWLANEQSINDGKNQIIQLTSEDPEDLTIRQMRWLGVADIILMEGDVPGTVLARARADAQRVPSEHAKADYPGQTVVRLVAPIQAA